MKLETTVAAAALALAFTAVAGDAAASNYPPDYPVCSVTETAWDGPFEFIRTTTNPYGHHSTLTIAYRGYLRDYYSDDQINIYINLNGNDAFLDASHGTNNDAFIKLISGPRDCHMCVPYMASGWQQCEDYLSNGGSPGAWLCSYETDVEEDIFFWAYNQSNTQNAWDIQVAAEANGWWDSDYGYNYRARFEPRNGCYN